jgi:Ca-activated chloride channel family protein
MRTPRVRRGIAASAVVLAAGGLILLRAPAGAQPNPPHLSSPTGVNSAQFSGPGAHGTFSLSHTKVLGSTQNEIFAELRLSADRGEEHKERAPLSIAVVLDTSGSMDGEKIEQARQAVIRLIGDMRDDDEIALVRYSDDSELVQSLARVGLVRAEVTRKVREITADGGTAIPRGLSHGLRALGEAGKGRVRRVVLVSDGLDSTREQAEHLAHESFERGITISSMGIGLDFDESYMGGVARAGHGNFGFVKDASALATFLSRELNETATTTIEDATLHVTLPRGVCFVRATGADATGDDGEVALKIGTLFAGDARRVILQLSTNLEPGETRGIDARVSWNRVGGGAADVGVSRLSIVATADKQAVLAGRDGAVSASAASVLASVTQLEAAEAYAHGDARRADALLEQSIAALGTAVAAAPAPAASALSKQVAEYRERKAGFAAARPTSTEGKAAAKHAFELDDANTSRSNF